MLDITEHHNAINSTTQCAFFIIITGREAEYHILLGFKQSLEIGDNTIAKKTNLEWSLIAAVIVYTDHYFGWYCQLSYLLSMYHITSQAHWQNKQWIGTWWTEKGFFNETSQGKAHYTGTKSCYLTHIPLFHSQWQRSTNTATPNKARCILISNCQACIMCYCMTLSSIPFLCTQTMAMA